MGRRHDGLTGRHWVFIIIGLLVLVGTLAWWQHVDANCDGSVVRGMWNQPVCTSDGAA